MSDPFGTLCFDRTEDTRHAGRTGSCDVVLFEFDLPAASWWPALGFDRIEPIGLARTVTDNSSQFPQLIGVSRLHDDQARIEHRAPVPATPDLNVPNLDSTTLSRVSRVLPALPANAHERHVHRCRDDRALHRPHGQS
ncbi:hypothetical protein [Burkholderia arboris]|uniref:hypothetical protein n=1 Tax=Burkholderia arboris TaxID=488730 RepID=UPI0015828302|nr:hypothetical protein [Burkholderia arboris]